MKILLPMLLAAFLGAAPCPAQDISSDASKLMNFNFLTSYSEAKKVTEVEIGYKRIYSAGNEPVFDKTLIGPKGLLTSETLSFLDDQGKILGTLSSLFNARGQLKSQTLKPENRPARALSWFKTGGQSPEISLAGSVLRASYRLKNGAFSTRTLMLQTPDGPRKIFSDYDAQGRRVRDVASSPKSPLDLQFFYADAGLVRFTVAPNDTQKAQETLLHRDLKGRVAEMLVKEEGILSARMTMGFDDGSPGGQLRVESYEAGRLSQATEFGVSKSGEKSQPFTQEKYDEGALVERKSLIAGANGEQQLQTIETFSAGQLQSRARYDEKGALLKTTFFKADGNVERVETVGAPVPLTP